MALLSHNEAETNPRRGFFLPPFHFMILICFPICLEFSRFSHQRHLFLSYLLFFVGLVFYSIFVVVFILLLRKKKPKISIIFKKTNSICCCCCCCCCYCLYLSLMLNLGLRALKCSVCLMQIHGRMADCTDVVNYSGASFAHVVVPLHIPRCARCQVVIETWTDSFW